MSDLRWKLLAAVCLLVVPGGTANDAHAAVEAPPVGESVVLYSAVRPGADELACRRILTRLMIRIPPWDRAVPWVLTPFVAWRTPPEDALEEQRRCLDLLDRPLVLFDRQREPTIGAGAGIGGPG